MLDKAGHEAIIEVDGGINEKNCAALIRNGAEMLVAGSALFGAPDAKAFVDAVKNSK